ncbi:MAG: gamma-glutamylcyclotransferase family protein [Candidatus Thorarchaeota archaeon]
MDRDFDKKHKCNKIFVYGTLQHGQSRNYILKGLKYEKATLLNYRKVEPPSLGFPFIIQDDNSKVGGEIYYDIEKSIINQIDMIEGEGELYHRILVKVKLDDGRETEAYTYYPSDMLIKNYL